MRIDKSDPKEIHTEPLLYWFTILLVFLLLIIQFLHYTNTLPQWCYHIKHSTGFNDIKVDQGYYRLHIAGNIPEIDGAALVINGKVVQVLSGRPVFIELNKRDIFEIDARSIKGIYRLKLTAENPQGLPDGYPEEVVISNGLYRFPPVR